MSHYSCSRLTVLAVAFGLMVYPTTADPGPNGPAIQLPGDASALEAFAAREVQRYVYLRTGELLPVVRRTRNADAIIVAGKGRALVESFLEHAAAPDVIKTMGSQDYLLQTQVDDSGHTKVYLIGGTDTAVLYAAYCFAEHLGIRFYLHGDVVPDERIPLSLPDLSEKDSPLFPLRGIQPFHDFPEGPDWWNTDDYKAIIGQLPKLRMNFIGLHTYPEDRPNAEPTVWIGLTRDVNPDGTVAFSYPSLYYSTALNASWGFQATKTSRYHCGAAALFSRDDYGSDVMAGFAPKPQSPEDCNEVFNRTATMFSEAFQLAAALGVKTCVGTETPLVVPRRVQERLETEHATVRDLYAGMFTRIMKAYPVDYYWFWTPETWTWEGTTPEDTQKTVDDILTAKAAAEEVGAPFRLATCGWVLGPQFDRAYLDKVLPKDIAVSCINRSVGHDPVEPAFAEVAGRDKWAIPWLEDDPAMTSAQLWVGRMRRDARDALAYGCTGLMGIHWRTRILGPNVAALAQAAWDQEGWGQTPPATGPVGGRVARFPATNFADTDDDSLYQSVRYDMTAYHLVVPDGSYKVTLQFCEPHYREPGKRVFGVRLEDTPVIEHLDVLSKVGPDRALVMTFDGISVTDGLLNIDFVKETEFPCIAAVAVEGPDFTQKINCGGDAYGDYIADPPPASVSPSSDDFYADWALHEFGPEAGPEAARIFSAIDGKLPRPSDWVNGPGGYRPDERPWEVVQKEYAFVDDLAALRPAIKTPGNRERFDYWVENLQFLRATARMRCAWGAYEAAMKTVDTETDRGKQAELVRDSALPLRIALIQAVQEAYRHLLATVNTSGAMGTVCNLEQHTFPGMLEEPGKHLADVLGEPLPPEAMLSDTYQGKPRLVVPTVRTAITTGEDLAIKVAVLDANPPRAIEVYFRTMGRESYRTLPLEHLARNTYLARIPSKRMTDAGLEYYIEAECSNDEIVRWPATGGTINQTVILGPRQ